MPRYDERSGPTRLYVGRLSTRTRSRDLEDLFSKYGRVRDVDMKHDFAFIDFSDPRDADDARHYLNGRSFEGSRIVVEFARRGPRDRGGSREYLGRGPPPGTGRCYNCGHDGHWARDCKAGDWKNKCYRCGQRGHIERNCRSSPRYNRSQSRSRSRSPSAGKRLSRSPSYSRSRSYSRSPRKEGRSSPARPDHRPRSASRSMSQSPPPDRELQSRSRSPIDNGQSPHGSPHQVIGRSVSESPTHEENSHKEQRSPGQDEQSPSQSCD